MKEKLNYQQLHFDGKHWSQDSITKISEMLEVWNTEHQIVVCHPNCIFAEKPVSNNHPDFDEIDWLNLKTEFTYNEDNSTINFIPESEETFKYIHRRFRHELFDEQKTQQPRHLVVVEQDTFGGNLVRGIFKATPTHLFVAYSPLYEKYKPSSIWDKSLRFTSDNCDSLQEFIDKNTPKNEPSSLGE